MFIKLLKWDFINQRFILMAMVVSMIATLVSVFLNYFKIPFVTTVSIFLAMIVVIVTTAIAFLYPLFYLERTTYGYTAYMSNAVAVKSTTLWYSKIIVGMFYFIIAILSMLLQFHILFSILLPGVNVLSIIHNFFKISIALFSSSFNISKGLAICFVFLFITFGLLSTQITYGFIVAVSNISSFQNMGKVRYLIGYLISYFILQISKVLSLFILPYTLEVGTGITDLDFSLKFKLMNIIDIINHNTMRYIPISPFIMVIIITFVFYVFVHNRLTHHFNLT